MITSAIRVPDGSTAATRTAAASTSRTPATRRSLNWLVEAATCQHPPARPAAARLARLELPRRRALRRDRHRTCSAELRSLLGDGAAVVGVAAAARHGPRRPRRRHDARRRRRLDVRLDDRHARRRTSSACARRCAAIAGELGGRVPATTRCGTLQRVDHRAPARRRPMGRCRPARAGAWSTPGARSSATPACTSRTARSCPGRSGRTRSLTIAALADGSRPA